LAQEKGGPMPNGYASHQNGLDADVLLMGIWLKDDLFLTWTSQYQKGFLILLPK